MDFSKIIFTLEFDDDAANERANEYLEKGWLLISVGPKLIEILGNGQAYYNTCYVVGATKEQYDAYLIEEENSSEDFNSFLER